MDQTYERTVQSGARAIIGSCAFLWLIAALFAAAPGAHADDNVLVMGAVHADALTMTHRLTPMADYVAAQLKPSGIDDVLIVVVPDRAALIELLRFQRVDWIGETAFNSLAIENSGLADMVARTWRGGSPSYRSLFVVHRDSNIRNLSDLDNRVVAFERDVSTSAFFIPAVELLEAQRTLCRLRHPQATAAPGCVGFAFAKRPYNTALWVHKGITAAGVLSSDDWASEAVVPARIRGDFRILFESEEVPRGIELVRSGLDKKVRQKLVEVLMAMHTDAAATQALASYFGTRRFDRLDTVDQENLSSLRTALPAFNREVGMQR